jgi:hypothetical protein
MFIELELDGVAEPVQINVHNISSINGKVIKMNNCDILTLTNESLHTLLLSIAPKAKKVKNNDPNSELLELFNKLNSLLKRKETKFTLQRETKLKELLGKHRLTEEDLIKAATNIGNNEWMQGKNDNKTVYAKIDYLLRPDKATQWAEREPEKKKGMF